MRWDVFCKVIDNHGDLGVCWRLAVQLAARGESVRLWVDDASALAWMAPSGHPGVEVLPWEGSATGEPGDIVIEAFGCELPAPFAEAIARATQRTGRQPAWINLEYLSAEPWVERCHVLPSPVLAGPGQGLVKHFFYPGFTAATGGLLRESDLPEQQRSFDSAAWLRAQQIDCTGERLVSLFCYEPPGLTTLLDRLARGPERTRLLVTAGRAQQAVAQALGTASSVGQLQLHPLPLLTQPDFDRLLWSCDLNFVRGEDSLVRALWAGRPAIWNLYPQEDGAHGDKLEAYLDWYGAPASMRQWHRTWNEGAAPPGAIAPEDWSHAALQARTRLLAMPDLVTQLQSFVFASGPSRSAGSWAPPGKQ